MMLNGVADSRESSSLSELSHPTHNIMCYKINVTYILQDWIAKQKAREKRKETETETLITGWSLKTVRGSLESAVNVTRRSVVIHKYWRVARWRNLSCCSQRITSPVFRTTQSLENYCDWNLTGLHSGGLDVDSIDWRINDQNQNVDLYSVP